MRQARSIIKSRRRVRSLLQQAETLTVNGELERTRSLLEARSCMCRAKKVDSSSLAALRAGILRVSRVLQRLRTLRCSRLISVVSIEKMNSISRDARAG